MTAKKQKIKSAAYNSFRLFFSLRQTVFLARKQTSSNPKKYRLNCHLMRPPSPQLPNFLLCGISDLRQNAPPCLPFPVCQSESTITNHHRQPRTWFQFWHLNYANTPFPTSNDRFQLKTKNRLGAFWCTVWQIFSKPNTQTLHVPVWDASSPANLLCSPNIKR